MASVLLVPIAPTTPLGSLLSRPAPLANTALALVLPQQLPVRTACVDSTALWVAQQRPPAMLGRIATVVGCPHRANVPPVQWVPFALLDPRRPYCLPNAPWAPIAQ